MVRRLILQSISMVVVAAGFFALCQAALQTYENYWYLALLPWAAIPVLACALLLSTRAIRWPERRLLFVACLTMVGAFGLFIFVLPACQNVNRANAQLQIRTRLTEIGKAMSAYCDRHGGRLPPAAIYSKDGNPLLSWRVALLPYLGHDELFRRFKLDESWDSPNNLPLASEMPEVFAIPEYLTGLAPSNTTRFQVYVGPGTAFEGRTGVDCDDFPDGKGNTLLVVIGENAVVVDQASGLGVGSQGPLARPAELPARFYPIVLLANGQVEDLRSTWTDAQIRAFITRNGGEPLPADR